MRARGCRRMCLNTYKFTWLTTHPDPQRIERDGIEVDKFVDFDAAMVGWHKDRDATVAKLIGQ